MFKNEVQSNFPLSSMDLIIKGTWRSLITCLRSRGSDDVQYTDGGQEKQRSYGRDRVKSVLR